MPSLWPVAEIHDDGRICSPPPPPDPPVAQTKHITWARTALKLTVEIVRRPDDLHTFKVLPRR